MCDVWRLDPLYNIQNTQTDQSYHFIAMLYDLLTEKRVKNGETVRGKRQQHDSRMFTYDIFLHKYAYAFRKLFLVRPFKFKNGNINLRAL